MTKQEFLDYVKSFNKQPYEYNYDDIVLIGEAHKKIEPSTDKSWSEVVKLIGWTGTAESLRQFIARRLKSKHTTAEISEPHDEEADKKANELIKKKTELFKEKQQVRDEWSTLRRGLREEARIETFKKAVEDSVSRLNALPKVEYVPSATNLDNEAILMLSDLHIGTLCPYFFRLITLYELS